MGKALTKFLSDEARRLRREANRMERKGDVGYETIIRIYRNDAANMERELAELEGAQ